MLNPEQKRVLAGTLSFIIKNPNADELLRIIQGQSKQPEKQITCFFERPKGKRRALRKIIDDTNREVILKRLRKLDPSLKKRGTAIVKGTVVFPKDPFREFIAGSVQLTWLDRK